MEKEANNTLALLDVFINNKDPTNLITSVYRKKTFTGLLTNFFSFTSISYKLALSDRYLIEYIKLIIRFLVSMRKLKNSPTCLRKISFLKA